MNTFSIILPSALIYIALVYWLIKYFKFASLWTEGKDFTSSANNRLTAIVKRILDFFLVFYLFIIIIWLPIMVVMALSQSVSPTWGIDIGAFASFKFDLKQIADIGFTGLRHPEISGKTTLNIDTSNLFAWYLFAITQLFSAIVAFYSVIQLRALILSFKNGLYFSQENARRIKKLGFILIIWNLLNPLVQYFGWGAVIKSISFTSPVLNLYPAFQLNIGALFIGVMLIILSKILQEASMISQEQELTI
ncbi:MAG: hypothetical protein COB38_13570 [Gammaproteobacteria bacterium]|nr:MAG: hypothetical protein COB38_13570 [Gammaproteobacteria bacterium]